MFVQFVFVRYLFSCYLDVFYRCAHLCSQNVTKIILIINTTVTWFSNLVILNEPNSPQAKHLPFVVIYLQSAAEIDAALLFIAYTIYQFLGRYW